MNNNVGDPAFYNLPFKVNDFQQMPYRTLGNSGLKVSNVGLGTWKMGYPETGDGSRVTEDAAFEILDLSIDLGVTFWDTANRYNNSSGNSERIIGKWLKNNASQRRNVVLATKLSGAMDGITPNHCGLSRTNILDALYKSLERLQVDYVDVLYFHSFDDQTPVMESLAAIEDLVRQDLVRYFAVSNFDVEQIRTYTRCADQLTVRSRIVAVQNQFDIINGEAPAHQGVLDFAKEAGISFVAWSPLARGLLTDRYLDATRVGPGDRLYDEKSMDAIAGTHAMAQVHELASLAKAWNIPLSELVIAYMLSVPGMGPIIPASSTTDQLRSNAKGGKLVLTDQQKEAVKAILKR